MRVANARPAFDSLVEQFGEDSVVELPDGERRCYYRRPDLAPEQNQRRAAEFNEMMAPSRAIDIELSLERSSKVPTMSIVRGGRLEQIPLELEPRIARQRGVIPQRTYSTVFVVTLEDGTLARRIGGKLEPTGHTHLGSPFPWHLASCPGCIAAAGADVDERVAA